MPLTHNWPGFYKTLRLKDPELLTEEDKEKLSLRVQKDYDPEKEDEPVKITREMIKEETGKESVGYG